MELVALVVVLVGVCWWFNFDNSIKRAADMANKEIEALEVLHHVTIVKRLTAVSNELTVDKNKKAEDVLEMVRSFNKPKEDNPQ
jgi:hypothetical protein